SLLMTFAGKSGKSLRGSWKDYGSRNDGVTGGAIVKTEKETGGSQTSLTDMKALRLSFTIPMGKVSNILGVINFLTNRFKRVDITIEAHDGSLSEQDYENKIKEAFEQIGVELRDD